MRTGFRFIAVAAAVLAIVMLGGCATTFKGTNITYSYEPKANFAEFKTYRWAEAAQTYRRDALLEANVRFLADRELEARGLTSKSDKPDLLISMGNELDATSTSYGYELRMLSLNISRADNNQLLWRGLASGSIKTDAASGDLKKAVEGMMANFPPK